MKKIINFSVSNILHSMITNEPEDRGMSWEYCFDFFQDNVLINKSFDQQYAALMLGFYLASWGMYRGSSQLLQKYTYTIHYEAIKIILDNPENIQKCFDELSEYYKGKEVSPTDTLITKIMLGVLGNVAAYDRFFVDGLRIFNAKFDLKLSYKFTEKNFIEVVETLKRTDIIKEIGNIEDVRIKTASQKEIPLAKKIDMYFWELGRLANL